MAQHYLLSKEFRNFSLIELMALSDDGLFNLLSEIRWGSKDQQACPDCGAWDKHYFRRTRKQWQCKHCFHTFSLQSGTLFSNLKLSYRQQAVGVFLFISAANGISAIEISKHLAQEYGPKAILTKATIHKYLNKNSSLPFIASYRGKILSYIVGVTLEELISQPWAIMEQTLCR